MVQIPALRWLGAIAAMWLLLAWAGGAHAQTEGDVYTVSGIPVDVTAADAVSARRQALVEGQRRGLERLLRRLVPSEEHGRLPPVETLPVERYVQNFSIGNEEVSSTRYIAQLTAAYDPEAVRELLQQQRLPFAQSRSAPVLVLPLYEGPDGARLWPEDNPWWQAWAETVDAERLLRLILPLGDLEDMAVVDVAGVRAGALDALLDLAARYGARDVLIATARVVPAEAEGGPPVVRLEARRIGDVERQGQPFTLRGQTAQDLPQLLAEAVERLQNSLDEQWKAANLLRLDQAGLMVVDIPIAALSDWVSISRGLQSLPEVNQIEVATFARDNVRAQIRYIGDEFRLEEALRRLDLVLAREGETWLLLPTGASPELGGPPNARPASSLPDRQ